MAVVALSNSSLGAPMFRGLRVATVLDRVADDGLEQAARGLDVTVSALELIVRLDRELQERREALAGRERAKPRPSTRPLLKLNPAIVANFKRQRIIDTVCLGLATGQLTQSVSEIVKDAELARKTFYDAYGSREAAMRAAVEWSAAETLRAAVDGGLDGLAAWCEARPEAVATFLLAAPQIDLQRYNALVDDAAARLGEGDGPVLALSGALTVAARRVREGGGIDASLLHDLAAFTGSYGRAE